MNAPRQIAKRIIADSAFSRSQGQQRTGRRLSQTSALPPKADSERTSHHVRFVPQPASCTAATQSLFNNLVRAGELPRWNGAPDRHVGLEIVRPVGFSGLPAWLIPLLLPSQDAH